MKSFVFFVIFLTKISPLKGEYYASNYFSTTQDSKLPGNVVAQSHEENLISCALSCNRLVECQGVNFDAKTKTCYLIDQSGVEYPQEFKKAPGFVSTQIVSF